MKSNHKKFARYGIAAALSMFALAGGAQAADRSGKQVVESVCISCHGSGKDGAPRIGNTEDWSKHANQGLEKLTQNAISGVRKMPAHGGQTSLTDLEMSRAIAYMVSGGRTTDPAKAYNTAQQKTGEQVVNETCSNCHATGKEGAPVIGNLDAWKQRLPVGLEQLTAAAIKGHDKMPARGGMAGLSDKEIKAAVNYMVSRLAGNK